MARRESMDLQGASAIVTGGASGLGNATARRLAEAGAAVVVVDLPDREGESLRADAVAALGDRARFITGDVTREEAAEEAVAAALEAGPLRVLVNCAGVATPGKLVGREGPLSAETLTRVLAINVVGTVSFMAHAAAAMKEQDLWGEDRGVIINTASVAAFDGQIGQVAYAASKGAVASMTLPVARELAAAKIRALFARIRAAGDAIARASGTTFAYRATVENVPAPTDPEERDALRRRLVEHRPLRLQGAARGRPGHEVQLRHQHRLAGPGG